MAGRAATTTIGISADVTAATVRGTGKVAAAAIGAGGDGTDESIKVAAKFPFQTPGRNRGTDRRIDGTIVRP